MDFLNFSNSRAVRRYWKKTGYQPTALEAAWLVYRCETASLEEKCRAWREIPKAFPDCPTGSLTGELKPEYKESTHAFLRAYAAQQERLAAVFLQTEGPAVYRAKYQLLPNGERFWREWRAIDGNFSSLEACIQAISRHEGKIRRIEVCRYRPDGTLWLTGAFLPDGRLAAAEPRPGSLSARTMTKSEWAVYTGVLFSVGPSWRMLRFPLPFRSGDLLYDPNRPEGVFAALQTDAPFSWLAFSQHGQEITLRGGRMLDCEYYPAGALTQDHQLLILLSQFLKGKRWDWKFSRDFTAFLRSYHDLLLPPPEQGLRAKANGRGNDLFPGRSGKAHWRSKRKRLP